MLIFEHETCFDNSKIAEVYTNGWIKAEGLTSFVPFGVSVFLLVSIKIVFIKVLHYNTSNNHDSTVTNAGDG